MPLLLASGFCGISYEILYGRALGNLIGDQFAVSSAVLLTFLLGIGFGTLHAHRLWKHLWAIEAGIGTIVGLVLGIGLSPSRQREWTAGTRFSPPPRASDLPRPLSAITVREDTPHHHQGRQTCARHA